MELKRLIPMLVLLTVAIAAGFFFAPKNSPAPEAPVAETETETATDVSQADPQTAQAAGDVDEAAQAAADDAQQAADAAVVAARDAEQAAQREAAAAAAEAQRLAAQARAEAASEPNWRVVKDSDIPLQADVLLGSTDPREGDEPAYAMTLLLTDRGASVAQAELNGFFVTVADKQLYDRDPAGYDEARLADPDKYRGRYPLLERVTLSDREVPAMAIRTVWLAMREGDSWRELGDSLDLSGRRWELVGDKVVGEGFEEATYRFVIYYGLEANDSTAVLQIDKTYRLDVDDYSLTMSVELTNLSENPIRVAYDQTGPAGLGVEDARADDRRTAVGRAKPGDKILETSLEEPKVLARMSAGEWRSFGNTHDEQPPVWVGTTNKYFATLMWLVPGQGEDNDGPSRQFDNAISMAGELWWAAAYMQKGTRHGDQASLTGMHVGKQAYTAGPTGVELEAGGAKTTTFSIYAGPKDRGIFDDAGNRFFRAAYKPLDFRSTIDFACCLNIPPLTFFIMWLLGMLASLSAGNYGVAIILLVILVRLLLHPLTKKSQLSMLKMQKLQPEIKKLQAKYADDKATLNQEMMRMYKEHGANPMLGCLPMLLQMPILIAMFTGINATVQLRHAAFLPVWITDMAAPDALITFAKPIPLLFTSISSFNLLPILLSVAMFFQTKMNPSMNQPSAASSSGDAMQQQQKMMKWMMPIMMLVFFYKAPSGLTLYFMASTAAGVIDQIIVRRHIQQADEAANANVIDVVVDAPGKSARGSRPKKPKPPFKTGS